MSTYREAVEQLEALKLEKRTEEASASLSPGVTPYQRNAGPRAGAQRPRDEAERPETRERVGVRAYPIEKRSRFQLYALPAPEAVQ